MIIDDDEIILDSCSQVLIAEGYELTIASDGEKGIQRMKEIRPELVLVDLKMPGKSGMEVLEEGRVLDPDCVLIVITGYGTIESAVEAMKRGAYDFLLKPFTPDELRLTVRRGLERRRSIEETRRLRHEKEMMRNNFVSMVSHELRSPLASVQQNLMVITDGLVGEIPDKVKEILDRMKIRIQGLISLISDWLDLSCIESGEMIREKKQVDIRRIVSDVVEMMLPLAEERNIKMEYRAPRSLERVMGNEETLRMVATNLIQNGIRYNHEGGKLDVFLTGKNGKLEIHVRDTGIGIPHEKLPLIFEQFYRIKGEQFVTGSGLGLSIVKKIVEAHDGDIQVESEVGKGTEFVVSLPFMKK